MGYFNESHEKLEFSLADNKLGLQMLFTRNYNRLANDGSTHNNAVSVYYVYKGELLEKMLFFVDSIDEAVVETMKYRIGAGFDASDVLTGVLNGNDIEYWDDLLNNETDPFFDSLEEDECEEFEWAEGSDTRWVGIVQCEADDPDMFMWYDNDHNNRRVYYKADPEADFLAKYNSNENTIQILWSKYVALGVPAFWGCYPHQLTDAPKWEGDSPMYVPPPGIMHKDWQWNNSPVFSLVTLDDWNRNG